MIESDNVDALELAPSERSFGLVFATVFLIVGTWFLIWLGSEVLGASSLFVSIVFLGYTALAPSKLSRLNFMWFKFGIALGKLMSPVILMIIFFGVFFPMAMLSRLIFRDVLKIRRKNRALSSLWINRSKLAYRNKSMDYQY